MGEDFSYGKQRLKVSKSNEVLSTAQFRLFLSVEKVKVFGFKTKFRKFPGIRDNIFDSGHETKLSKFFVDDFAATEKIFDQIKISFENNFRIL